ncbi:hypothetical protein AURANDRAFT_67405 [Aureococcus anophagefferens]|uniref:PPM-type phosphatase domain-containing protein n=1 Tax=Aureococcus anophagefferens TaxID=44056 RepID=F0YL12_AURAN|nr:hypothetical protein AURANDRAFT_67405 [Aureococcus anophagefferens]EGB04227.1 hypothetical protein AURANDRAFT_67405 [Aureococcus anophagefferens]|eukprot:XP_009041078.1 hypothetical protein AURANDRAFT_67405 [Aureococcus anophagefferens]
MDRSLCFLALRGFGIGGLVASKSWRQMGLAMSRSFGDSIVHGLGVSCEPEITDHRIDESDAFLIWLESIYSATDGVWDVIDNNQAAQIVHSHLTSRYARPLSQPQHTTDCRSGEWDPSEAAHMLCMSARRRWESLSPMIDDITALVVDLHKLTGRLR